MILDLHGIKHQDVTRQLDIFIWEQMNISVSYFQIVTGNSETMKNLVKECLKEYGLVGREEIFNSGTITVDL